MARKTQCISCKHLISFNCCAIKGSNLDYDDSSCSEYEKDESIKFREKLNESADYGNYYFEKQKMFQRPFSFKGRIRRTEYCLSFLIYVIYSYPMEANEYDFGADYATFWLLLLVPMVWFILAQGVKRCHDMDNSGWWQLVPGYILLMLFSAGDKEVNDYGEPTKIKIKKS